MSLQSVVASSPVLFYCALAAAASHAEPPTPAEPLLASGSPAASRQAAAALTEALRRLGLVDVSTRVPSVVVALKYAREDNFMGEAVYGSMKRCFLRPEAAAKLARAQVVLEQRRPGCRLLMYDCLRPRSVQRRMWSIVRGTDMQSYVARPDPGSMHNHGAAVDIGIVDEAGEPLDMGTMVDHFGVLAQPRHEARFLREGKLTTVQVGNRALLREVMGAAGFRGVRNEWWHFEAFSVREIRRRYAIVEELPNELLGPVRPTSDLATRAD